jgi:hypothetical protein
MAECQECGAKIAPDEFFCGNCGTQQLRLSAATESAAAAMSSAEDSPATTAADEGPSTDHTTAENLTSESSVAAAPAISKVEPIDQPTLDDSELKEPLVVSEPLGTISSDSLGGAATGSVHTNKAGRTGTTGGHQPTIKQLEGGTVLNGRYEIVRRIGGGGMGAVYLAKDRNLGDAPRAVKEMVEAHLDPMQHEKAIGDFKRESLLLTSLEHPSIPTIYDYFYDDALGRFYIVMK